MLECNSIVSQGLHVYIDSMSSYTEIIFLNNNFDNYEHSHKNKQVLYEFMIVYYSFIYFKWIRQKNVERYRGEYFAWIAL